MVTNLLILTNWFLFLITINLLNEWNKILIRKVLFMQDRRDSYLFGTDISPPLIVMYYTYLLDNLKINRYKLCSKRKEN